MLKIPIKQKLAGGWLWLISSVLIMQAQTGGSFTVTQSVVANGGGGSSGGTFTVNGTTGQPAAGTNSTGGVYGISGGFWQNQLAPTAAGVSVSGRVTTADGRGIRGAKMMLSNSNDQTAITATTGSFGYYRFDDVTAGQTYVLSVTSKRFSFIVSSRLLSVNDEITDEDFVALPN